MNELDRNEPIVPDEQNAQPETSEANEMNVQSPGEGSGSALSDAAAPEDPAEETPEESGEAEADVADAAEDEHNTEDGEDTEDKEDKGDKKESKDSPAAFLFDVLELVGISLAAVMLLLTFVVRHSPVNGSSMYPTIDGRNEITQNEPWKDVLLISKLFYTPKTGDIVVIQTPTVKGTVGQSLGHPIVKRVIAVGGDTLTIDFKEWRVTVNGEVLEDGFGSVDYVNYKKYERGDGTYAVMTRPNEQVLTETGCTVTKESDYVYTFTIPEGKLFVMGDNRNNSTDSRAIGLIDERWVVGRSLARIYPFSRIGKVR